MQIGENSTQVDNKYVKEKFVSFCDLFKLQVRKNPSAIAAIFEENTLTYEELDHQSSQLAGFLRANGVESETIVALSLRNSLDLLVGILGILKSGGAYLPIDPNYPAGRIESMIEDAEPAILLTEDSLSPKFSHLPSKIVVVNKLYPMDHISQDEFIHPDHLAYVVYTSGSTGKPKGIMIEHGALSHASLAYQKLHPNKLVSLVAGSISFDASLLVISHTLASGGIVCIPKSEVAVDPQQIIALIEKHGINYTLCVPSFYSMLLIKSQRLPSLQSVDLGGENIPNDIPGLHTEIAPNATLYNVYGPSEYAIGATFAKIYDPITKQVNRITIGKPLRNTQVYILDENLQQVSTGVKGEIFIGGEGLARGYLNKKALSTEKFIWVSLPDQESVRLYRTGDFGRILPDGNIEFLGRKDHQVKIRGYRIELGEVEYWICQHPEVSKAVVFAQEEKDGRKRLVAYFSGAPRITIDALRLYLSDLLPTHMIPSSFVKLEQFPLLSNGKIDRKALLEFPVIETKEQFAQQPQSHFEQVLVDIWKTILQREGIGIHDNFFDVGGDSLGLAIMQTSIQTALGIEVPIVGLFCYPTISQLAQHLNRNEQMGMPLPHSTSKHQVISEKRKAAFQRLKERNLS